MRIQKTATIGDQDTINRFLDEDVLLHRHLDFFSLDHWIGKPGVIIDETDGEITGVLLNTSTIPTVSWVRLFASIRPCHREIWQLLFAQSLAETRNTPIELIATLSFAEWYTNLLTISGFNSFYAITVLAIQNFLPPHPLPIPGIQICRVTPADIEAITRLDHAAFNDIWQFSAIELHKAISAPCYATLAKLDGIVIGYQITSVSQSNAHLVRLAMLPDYQNQHIAKTLVSDLLNAVYTRGIHQVTVNTQSNNAASLALYDHIGFHPTGQNFPVFTYLL